MERGGREEPRPRLLSKNFAKFLKFPVILNLVVYNGALNIDKK